MLALSFSPSPATIELATLLAKATLLLLVAFGAATLLQRAAAGARHLVWVAILGAILLLPALSAWSPLRLAILPASLLASASSQVNDLPATTSPRLLRGADGSAEIVAPTESERAHPYVSPPSLTRRRWTWLVGEAETGPADPHERPATGMDRLPHV